MQPACVVKGEGPELHLEFIGPMHVGVLHHCAGLFRHSANVAFRDAVLVVCSDAREFEFLIWLRIVGERIGEFLGLEDAVVAMIFLDFDATRFSGALEGSFRDYRIGGAQGHLMRAMDEAARMIAEDGSTSVLVTKTLSSSGRC